MAGVLSKALRPMGMAVLLTSALVLASCVEQKGNDSSLRSNWVRPLDPQESIGKKEHPAVIAKYGGVYANPKAERMIAVVVDRLIAVSDDPSRVFKVTLLNSPKINAFALPGGYLYLTRGLLALANDSSELAAVLAHEMAHVSANHALVRQEKLNSSAISKKVVTDVLDGSTAGKIALAADKMRFAAFSQNQELQADAIGIRMIGKAGYDPYAAERFLKTMAAYSEAASGNKRLSDAMTFTSSHPSTPRRITLAKNHARAFGAPGYGDRGRQRFLDGIDGLMYGDSADEGFVRGQTFSHKGLGITFQAPKGFKIDNQSKAVLVSGPDDIATRFDATVVRTGTTLVNHLKDDWIKGLVEETIREETINGLRAATASAAGDGWRFKVWLVRNNNQVFRFITAAPQTNTNLDPTARQIVSSFRLLSNTERANLRPLTIKLVSTSSGRGIAGYVKQMRGVPDPAKTFRLINGLSAGESIADYERVKIVTDR